MMKQKASFTWLFIPLTIYLALMAILLMERSGLRYEVQEPSLEYLAPDAQPQASAYTEPPVEGLVLFDGDEADERKAVRNMTETLNSMRVKYDVRDIHAQEAVRFEDYKTAVLVFRDLAQFSQLHEMEDWVEKGGLVFFALPPDVSGNFSSFYRKIGIRSLGDAPVRIRGVAFVSDLLPGSQGVRLQGSEGFLTGLSYAIQLDPESRVHLTSADDYQLPLLWERDYGLGRFVVTNSDQFVERINRGILAAAYNLLQEISVYPVINSSVYFIDDFPAPIPLGEYLPIRQKYNVDIRDFMLNVWWPDMAYLADKYGLKYTGAIIETYNDRTSPPFALDVSVDDHRYVGRLLLKKGGEIALHGYNHIPLCLQTEGHNELYDYPYWPSTEDAQKAVQSLNKFGQDLFPGVRFRGYVPPSNILCPEARQWLPKVLPDLQVISSLLLNDEDNVAYEQDFEEAPDGMIEFPRIVSGYELDEYFQLALLNELSLHYVNSFFIHPDDILDAERSEDKNWEHLRDAFEHQVSGLKASAPGLRSATLYEGAMATQRFYRLQVNAKLEGEQYSIHLGNFYDEAWLMLRTTLQPVEITGGTITKVTSSLYLIQAEKPDIQIRVTR